MRLRVAALLLALIAALANVTLSLPVAVKNVTGTPVRGYIVFFTVEKERLLAEGIDPATLCAVDPAGDYLPIWVSPETLQTKKVAVYVRIPYLAPRDQLTITLTPGPCAHDPKWLFIFFDNFVTLDTSHWTLFATPMVYDSTVRAGAINGRGLLITGTYKAPDQYLQIMSRPFTPPFAVEALITPMTAFDHDACLDVREYGTEGAHPADARGAYIHAWGYGVSGETDDRMGRFAWYRVAGPPRSANYHWDVTTWSEGGTSPVFNANETFLLRIGVSPDVVRYEVWQLKEEGLVKLLGHLSNLGITNETIIVLAQECGAFYNFTQKAIFHWVLVRPFVWPEPKVVVGAERLEESPPELILEFLSEPANLRLIFYGALTLIAVLILLRERRRS